MVGHRQAFNMKVGREYAIGWRCLPSPLLSGDILIAFSSNERNKPLSDQSLNAFFRATIEAVEEAVLNSLFKAETMSGRDNNIREAVPITEVMSLLQERKCLDS